MIISAKCTAYTLIIKHPHNFITRDNKLNKTETADKSVDHDQFGYTFLSGNRRFLPVSSSTRLSPPHYISSSTHEQVTSNANQPRQQLLTLIGIATAGLRKKTCKIEF